MQQVVFVDQVFFVCGVVVVVLVVVGQFFGDFWVEVDVEQVGVVLVVIEVFGFDEVGIGVVVFVVEDVIQFQWVVD